MKIKLPNGATFEVCQAGRAKCSWEQPTFLEKRTKDISASHTLGVIQVRNAQQKVGINGTYRKFKKEHE